MHTFDDRFLKFNGLYNYTDWDVVRGVPWSTEWHKHFPREFHGNREDAASVPGVCSRVWGQWAG